MPEPSLTPTGFAALDECRDRFEAAWKARPRLGDFLPAASIDPAQRSRALRELLLLDIHYRRQRGETPLADDYLAELPGEADVVRDALSSACAGTSQTDLGNASTIPSTDSPGGEPRLAAWSASRFRILESHAKGGLGEVFLAEDLELRREVALKEIQAPFLQHASARRRFALEGEVTGQLEHPGIVPVYSLGVYPDGRPFYAMRLIRGQSLSAAIRKFHEERKRQPESAELELRQLLGRFAQVCNAVAYAHSRGVIHRDIKPSNVMLGDFGETLLVDWGLAKRKGPQEAAPEAGEDLVNAANTQQGSWLGTPAYMSPEQAAGDIERTGPASDVYSLGATLYHLLTGKPSIQGNDPDMLRTRIRTGDFEPPRQVQGWIAKPLEAVCLKAMGVNQSDRYPSPQALAADIEHWLADEPVSCLAEPAAVRARRWIKRHPALVVGTAATVLISLVSLAAIASIVGQSNRTLSKKNLELEAANGRERAATDLAQKNERTAEGNAEVAREQSQLALKSLATVIFEIQAKLRIVPGAGDLQRELLQTALARLQEVSDQFAARSRIDRYTKVALDDLGDVFLRIGSGMPGGVGADGPLTAARKVYDQALDIAQSLAAADPTDPLAQNDLSLSYTRLGKLCVQAGQVTEALAHYQKGLEISQKLATANPTHVQAQRGLRNSYENLGDMSLRVGNATEALGYYQMDLEISQRLAAADPSDAQAQRDLSVSHGRLGHVSLQSGQVSVARGHFQKGLEISQGLAAADPTDGQAQLLLSSSHSRLGDVSLQSGQMTEALGHYQKSHEIDQKLAATDPTDAQAQHGLSVSYGNLGTVSLRTGQVAEALGYYQKGLEIRLKLAAADPTDAQAHRDLSVSYDNLGDVSLQTAQVTEALVYYQKGLEIRLTLAAADPADLQAQRDLSVSYHRLGNMSLQSGQMAEALGSYQVGLEISQKLAAADPTDAQAQRDLSVAYQKIGDVSFRSGRLSEALGYYQKDLEIGQKLAATDPTDAQAQVGLVISFERLGSVLRKQRQYEPAIKSYGRGLQVLQSLNEQKRLPPANEAWIPTLEQLIQQCQLALQATGDWQKLLEQPAEMLPVLLEMRGIDCVQEGRTSDAVQAVAELRELRTATADQLYNAVCVYSLCAAGIKATDGELNAELTPEQAAERQRHIADALATLGEAIQAGYNNFDHMRQDPDLAVLRELAEFQALFPATAPKEP